MMSRLKFSRAMLTLTLSIHAERKKRLRYVVPSRVCGGWLTSISRPSPPPLARLSLTVATDSLPLVIATGRLLLVAATMFLSLILARSICFSLSGGGSGGEEQEQGGGEVV
ncbi:hypothetical protein GUJ93_ZPchr0002g23317 [Zizania palustris]|uniref:Uncharacterized protein n=1 Tax=Zizania palustris TaxID=103762 RepID=A0A8J5RSS9_ZIZPA|nr:hypothetical protein GUJ93_ZPchr0002g23317 [Zizania palustris]